MACQPWIDTVSVRADARHHGDYRLALRCGVAALLAAPVLIAACLPFATLAAAQDATWLAAPGSSDFDTSSNWSPATVPTDTAFFGTSNATSLTFSVPLTTSGGWTFNSGASNYTFNNSTDLHFTGAGIIINGGSAAITNNAGGFVFFFNNSTAGNAVITNNTAGTDITFENSSTAGGAAITNNASGSIGFSNNSTASSAAITNNAGTVDFSNSSTAGSAFITNNNNGLVRFFNSGTAGSATITNNAGGVVNFFDASNAGSAVFINNAGGLVDFSGSAGFNGDKKLTAGSIAGAGNFYLGGNQLTVGGDTNTTVSGTISDCGASGTASRPSASCPPPADRWTK